LPYSNDEKYVLSFKPRVTKAGKKMANMIVADASRDMESIVIFPTMFSQAYMKCEPGKANKMIFDLTRDGTKTLKEVGQ
jgi:DNA polymerase III alpha subunit